ncbi:hypothetical protein [Mammaliicoccus sciuri]|uniref:hypothetical protein n=1 Tax=Mammaliicoccus sciuri TaxID=1296 RepID=UPI003F570E13
MKFKQILIIDITNKEANKYIFDDKSNLIVSKKNTQGKSSLIKFIYYNLGLDIKNFPAGWDVKNMIFELEVEQDNKLYKILRYKNKYKINRGNFINAKEYSEVLQSLLGINVLLPHKLTKNLIHAYSSAIILPFYIDQDNSWSGIPYKNTTNSINQYDKMPQRIFEYIFNLSDEDIQKLLKKKEEFKKKKSIFDEQIKVLKEYLNEEFQKDEQLKNIVVEPLDVKKLEEEINNYLNLINDYNRDIRKYKLYILKYEKERQNLEIDIEELKKLLSLNKKEYKNISYKCTECNSELTKEQSLKRFDINNNILEINELKILFEEEKKKVITRLEELFDKKETIEQKSEKILSKLEDAKYSYRINDYIEAVASEKSYHRLSNNINEKTLSSENLKNNIKEVEKEIKELKKEKEERKKKLKNKYTQFYLEINLKLSNQNNNNIDFIEFKNIDGSGMNTNKLYLSYYLTYYNLILEEGKYLIPYGVDSFLKNESSMENQKEMFKIVEDYMIKRNNQSFFSILEENLVYFSNEQEYFKVLINDRLLNSEYYLDNKNYIENILG